MKYKVRILIILSILIIIALAMKFLHIDCPMITLFGISCPGCGLSRSQFALLQLDFVSAFRFHPLFFVPIPLAIWAFFRADKKWKTYESVLFAGIMLTAVVVYVIRMFMHDPILQCDFTQGFLYRLLFS